MAKKKDAYYFDNFITCADYACQEAHLLKQILEDFHPEDVSRSMDEIHVIERKADEEKHQLMEVLKDAFITPIEREDIAALSALLDDVIDKIDEVMIRIYINNVQQIRPEALKMIDVIIECCEEMQNLLREFRNFKSSDKLHDSIVHINSLEEKEDNLFISSMRTLHTGEADIRSVIAWREIYTYLEKCADACEHVADVIASVTMKNS